METSTTLGGGCGIEVVEEVSAEKGVRPFLASFCCLGTCGKAEQAGRAARSLVRLSALLGWRGRLWEGAALLERSCVCRYCSSVCNLSAASSCRIAGRQMHRGLDPSDKAGEIEMQRHSGTTEAPSGVQLCRSQGGPTRHLLALTDAGCTNEQGRGGRGCLGYCGCNNCQTVGFGSQGRGCGAGQVWRRRDEMLGISGEGKPNGVNPACSVRPAVLWPTRLA